MFRKCAMLFFASGQNRGQVSEIIFNLQQFKMFSNVLCSRGVLINGLPGVAQLGLLKECE